MKNLIKEARIRKNKLIKDVAIHLNIDAALVSKWESGTRVPSKIQAIKLASFLDIDTKKILVERLSEIILKEIGEDEFALEAMLVAEAKVSYGIEKVNIRVPKTIKSILSKIDTLKNKLQKIRHLDSYKITEALELEYTFESNRIEGNTLTLKETDLVINEGITISGKSMREHLEAINHIDAIAYLKLLIDKKQELKERDILQLHNLVLRGIDARNAGKYRTVQVMIKGSKHMQPQPYLVPKQMEDLFYWFELNKKSIHPVLLAAEMSERLVTIHPFIDGNGRTSRLLMNLILLKNGYVIANIKGDAKSRMSYYNVLENAQVEKNKLSLFNFVANTELIALERYLQILGA